LVEPKKYVPERGDVVWITLNPQAGHEQAGRRPALILSPKIYNIKSRLAILCPITNQVKGYPFEVPIPDNDNLTVKGVILADQVKSLDWQIREATLICTLPEKTVIDVLQKLVTLLS
jgi:mRNA interferase MazF